jgi:hypothetical protein
MRDGTSGFHLTEKKDGSISIFYADYGVSQFDGGDFENTYILNADNTKLFREALAKEYSGTLDEMIEAAFGRSFSDWKFKEFCKENGIRYSNDTWVSAGDWDDRW